MTHYVTGVNRGLGWALALKLANRGSTVRGACRNPSAVATVRGVAVPDTFDLACKDSVLQTLAAIRRHKATTVYHCASPYSRSAMLAAPPSELEKVTQAAVNEMLFLRACAEELAKNKGSLFVCGAIVGAPGYTARGLFSWYKANVRTVSEVLHHEAKGRYSIRHLNLGTFSDDPELIRSGDAISTSTVADRILALQAACDIDDVDDPWNVDIMAPNDPDKLSALLEDQTSEQITAKPAR